MIKGVALDEQRVDKWLMVARFFKTRQIAIDAIIAGRVSVNDERAKPSRVLKIGDRVLVRKPPYEWRIVVRQLSAQRGAASVASALYEEDSDSVTTREELRRQQREAPAPLFPGRPTKRDRRMMEKFLSNRSPDGTQD